MFEGMLLGLIANASNSLFLWPVLTMEPTGPFLSPAASTAPYGSDDRRPGFEGFAAVDLDVALTVARGFVVADAADLARILDALDLDEMASLYGSTSLASPAPGLILGSAF
jgi:hypothetical protein